jgi:pSer/pThr/pTyr-binding forkhead associated (FHA) protein
MCRSRPNALIFLSLIFCAAVLVRFLPAAAQSEARVTIYAPQTNNYPEISFFLDAHDAAGNFVHDLTQADLRVVENGQSIPVDQITETSPGVQFALAFSPGHTLSIRDGLGLSRFDYVILGLNAWEWDAQAASNDDLSLITADGPEAVHFSDPGALISALKAYQPNLRNSVPNLEVLTRALEVVGDEPPRPGMERAILFITPLQPAEAGIGLQSLAARAAQEGVRIFVWLVTTPDAPASIETSQLSNLAAQTGGSLFTFTGIEGIPNLETYLEPLRHIYNLSYTSILTTTGTFPLQVEVAFSDQMLASNTQEIALEIQPPNPIFLSLPPEISRSLQNTPAQTAVAQKETSTEWAPVEQALQILVEFPDGHNRPVVQSALYVDGVLLQANSTPPFEKFTWDLRPYTESGVHQLQVEVTDHLGLTGRSIEIPVQVNVEQPDIRFKIVFSGRNLLFLGALVLFAGTVLGLVLVLGGRIQPSQPGKLAHSRVKPSRPAWPRRSSTNATSDPVTQPVRTSSEEPTHNPARRTLRVPRSQARFASQTFAYLTPVLPAGEAHQEAPIPIHTDVVLFGRDPLQATWVIEDESLEALHARLVREGNTYRLVDANTTAGTWVNYTSASQGGILLEHGDLIHLGGSGFRFSLRPPGKIRKPIIHHQEHAL